MSTTFVNSTEAEQAFDQLYRQCCDTCLWFWRRNGVPTTTADRVEALRQIEQNGTMHQFMTARELRKWL